MSKLLQFKRVLRFLVEFGVIALGVFLALAAESWWAGSEDRRFEYELREDIRVEFQANLRILKADIASNDKYQIKLGSLSELSDVELLAIPSEELTEQLKFSVDWAGFDPEMGIVQALVESGNVSVISDREVRLHLSQWAGLLKEKRRFNLQTVEFELNHVVPVIARVTADQVWTDMERREVRTLLEIVSNLHLGVVRNQRRLHAVALIILRSVDSQ